MIMNDRMISFEKLSNFRDLGGLVTRDGRRIKGGKLIRGGNLFGASDADIEKLSDRVELVVDFRTEGEISEKPDPEIPGAKNWHLPVLETITEGVSREKDADQHSFERFMADPDAALNYMVKTYEHMAKSSFALNQQKLLLQRLLEPGKKGVLWHCTAGKDRTGIFALIIEEILGVPRDTIIEDYLLTNQGNYELVEHLVQFLSARSDVDPETAVTSLRIMFGAREEYILAFYREAEQFYGNMDIFLEKTLGADSEMRKVFRELYLI